MVEHSYSVNITWASLYVHSRLVFKDVSQKSGFCVCGELTESGERFGGVTPVVINSELVLIFSSC